MDASFEYCSPSQNIKATDLNGQIINTQIEEFKQTSFECNYSDVSFVLFCCNLILIFKNKNVFVFKILMYSMLRILIFIKNVFTIPT